MGNASYTPVPKEEPKATPVIPFKDALPHEQELIIDTLVLKPVKEYNFDFSKLIDKERFYIDLVNNTKKGPMWYMLPDRTILFSVDKPAYVVEVNLLSLMRDHFKEIRSILRSKLQALKVPYTCSIKLSDYSIIIKIMVVHGILSG
jgi:hypothetical protein